MACQNGSIWPMENCVGYHMCSNGQIFDFKCGPGTLFNPVTKVCDFPFNVDCPPATTTSTTTTTTAPTSTEPDIDGIILRRVHWENCPPIEWQHGKPTMFPAKIPESNFECLEERVNDHIPYWSTGDTPDHTDFVRCAGSMCIQNACKSNCKIAPPNGPGANWIHDYSDRIQCVELTTGEFKWKNKLNGCRIVHYPRVPYENCDGIPLEWWKVEGNKQGDRNDHKELYMSPTDNPSDGVAIEPFVKCEGTSCTQNDCLPFRQAHQNSRYSTVTHCEDRGDGIFGWSAVLGGCKIPDNIDKKACAAEAEVPEQYGPQWFNCDLDHLPTLVCKGMCEEGWKTPDGTGWVSRIMRATCGYDWEEKKYVWYGLGTCIPDEDFRPYYTNDCSVEPYMGDLSLIKPNENGEYYTCVDENQYHKDGEFESLGEGRILQKVCRPEPCRRGYFNTNIEQKNVCRYRQREPYKDPAYPWSKSEANYAQKCVTCDLEAQPHDSRVIFELFTEEVKSFSKQRYQSHVHVAAYSCPAGFELEVTRPDGTTFTTQKKWNRCTCFRGPYKLMTEDEPGRQGKCRWGNPNNGTNYGDYKLYRCVAASSTKNEHSSRSRTNLTSEGFKGSRTRAMVQEVAMPPRRSRARSMSFT